MNTNENVSLYNYKIGLNDRGTDKTKLHLLTMGLLQGKGLN